MTIDLYELCYDCATERGWTAVPWPVGMWMGECDICHETKALCSPRDYYDEHGKPMGQVMTVTK